MSTDSSTTDSAASAVSSGPGLHNDHDAEPHEAPAPPYTPSVFTLRCTTPAQSSRYHVPLLPRGAQPRHGPIAAGLYSWDDPGPRDIHGTVTQVDGWVKLCHPEGQTYWHNPQFRFMTRSALENPRNFQLIIACARQVDELLRARGMRTGLSVELVLEPESDMRTCGYYFVDHVKETIFWAEDTSTLTLGLSPPSSSNLKFILKQQYYIHIEYFPAHLKCLDARETRLIGMLTHGCVDGMTSDDSTFPYDAEQCRAFLQMLGNLPDSVHTQAYRNCIVGRLLAEIYGTYVVNFHDEIHARLSRRHSLLPDLDIRCEFPRWISWIDKILWQNPAKYHEALCDLWVDRIAYFQPWNKFVEQLACDWLRSGMFAGIGITCGLILRAFLNSSAQKASLWIYVARASSSASISLGLISLTSGMVLVQNRPLAQNAGDVNEFLVHRSHEGSVWCLLFLSFAITLTSFDLMSHFTEALALLPFVMAVLLIGLTAYLVKELPSVNYALMLLGDIAHRAARV
ncbi:hypothetical protein SISNIDRAFT_489373 [Sistotremastrum niveocremeum HHB9708]|uniref:WW domain-containing protein n=1 Tax=Sistotremastrum niveocremeum HHB9708 TaxID=1314777 RepID=A0A164Q875_9AGAM|nr:hypothetical protein SISNIDRAFT_489373 [Sistotremastrum niveocremeum HHB9708]